jgi:hypothetical protein
MEDEKNYCRTKNQTQLLKVTANGMRFLLSCRGQASKEEE